MSRQPTLARRRARWRAVALAASLHGDICGLLGQESVRGPLRHGNLPAATGATAPAYLAQQMRTRVSCIDEFLTFGLHFDFDPDPELRYRRAHVRNTIIMIRRNIESALTSGGRSVLRSDHLAQARRFVEDLVETISWVDQRVLAIEAGAPDDSWSKTWPATVLAVASKLLPVHQRKEFIEDQCGNLTLVSSHSEWAHYMLDLLVQMPRIAAAAHLSRDQAVQPRPGE